MNAIIAVRNKIINFCYTHILKRIFFRFDPEFVHDRMTENGILLGKFWITRSLTWLLFGYSNPVLEQTIAGIHFKNPVGLSAGFDKNALLTNIIPSVGFGFEEIGSVTGKPCTGNIGQRLWRLPKSKSLVVYYGLKNDGAEAIAQRVQKLSFAFPVGISLAKTNNKETVEETAGIQDYTTAYKAFLQANVGDYFTINISCPNTYGGEPFTEPDKLERLLSAFKTVEPNPTKPIFIKLPAELPYEVVDALVEVSRRYHITGFVCTNLAKKRNPELIKDTQIPEVGGLSGMAVQKLSDDLIAYLYKKYGQEFVYIGVGGIFSAEDAYRKIKNGASLLQMITGMIFEGPQVVSEINRGLVALLKKDGYTHISQAIGKNIT